MTSFIIESKPIAKQRPRAGRGGNFYTPQKTKDFEDLVRWSYLASHNKHKYIDCPIGVEIEIHLKQPKDSKQLFPIKRTGDIDNQVKSILDGLNNLAYNDDSQVVKLIASKQYDERDYIVVKINSLS